MVHPISSAQLHRPGGCICHTISICRRVCYAKSTEHSVDWTFNVPVHDQLEGMAFFGYILGTVVSITHQGAVMLVWIWRHRSLSIHDRNESGGLADATLYTNILLSMVRMFPLDVVRYE